jgi:hypothetical protein
VTFDEFLQRMPNDWRRGPAVRKWMAEADAKLTGADDETQVEKLHAWIESALIKLLKS